MAESLGQTRISAYEAATDDQLLKLAEHATTVGNQQVFTEAAQELKNRKAPGYAQIAASAGLGVPIADVDVKSGMRGTLRARLSMAPTEEERVRTAQKALSDGKVTVVPIDGRPQLFYQSPNFNEGRATMIEDFGTTPRDFADLIGEAYPTAGAIAAGILTAPLSPFMQASSVTLASRWNASVQDAIVRFVEGEQVSPKEIAARRASEAPVEFALNYGALKALGVGSRGIASGTKSTPADTGDVFQALKQSYDDLEAKFNMTLDRTAGVRSSEQLAAKESAIAENIPNGMLATRLAGIRDTIGDMLEAMRGNPSKSYREAVNTLRQRVNAQAKILEGNVDDAAMRTFRSWESALNDRLDSLGYKLGQSRFIAGEDTRRVLEQARAEGKAITDNAYGLVDQAMEQDGVFFDPQVVAAKLRTFLRNSNIPKDEQGEVISEFLTPQMRDIARKATGLDDPSPSQILDAFLGAEASEVAPISYGTMRSWRSELGSRINWNDTSIKTRDSRAVYKMLTDMMRDAEQRSSTATKQLLADAQQKFDQNVLPYRDGALADVLSKGAKEYNVANEDVLSRFFNPTEIRRLKAQLGNNHPVIQQVRNAYLDGLLGDAANVMDGYVNVRTLKAASKLDDDFLIELYGDKGRRAIREINRLASLQSIGDADAVVKPDALLQMFEARTPADVSRLASNMRKQMVERARLEKFRSQAIIKAVLEDKVPYLDEHKIVDAFFSPATSRSQVRSVLMKVPKEERAALQQEFFSQLLNRAGMGSGAGTRMTAKRGKNFLWDTNKMQQMLTDPKMSRIINSVLGKEGETTLKNLNAVLASARATHLEPLDPLKGRVVASMRGPQQAPSLIAVMSNIPRWGWNKLLSAAYGSKTLTRLLSDTKDARELFQRLSPAVLSTSEGLQSIGREAEKDPRFGWLFKEQLSPTDTEPAQ